jgi:hypothetical protein
MKQSLVSVAAILLCVAIVAIVAIFSYSRYKASQIDDARFQQQLQSGAANPQGALGARMPEQLPARSTGVDAGGAPAHASP